MTDKLAAYTKLQDEVNVLFFGTSKIHSGIIPEIFDETAASQGIRTRSFNAGVDGMRFPEGAWYCEQFLARRPAALRWVFLELADLRIVTPPAYAGTRRASAWRDWPRTWQMWESARLREPGNSDLLREHAWLWLQRASNVGEGAEWWDFTAFPHAPPRGRDRFQEIDRGYMPIPFPMPAKERADFARSVTKLPQVDPQSLDPIAERVFLNVVARIREAGATPIFLLPPNPRRSVRGFESLGAEKPMVWDFERPDLYPELYAPEHRGDFAHLNHAGAQIWTKLVAKRFAAAVQAGAAKQ